MDLPRVWPAYCSRPIVGGLVEAGVLRGAKLCGLSEATYSEASYFGHFVSCRSWVARPDWPRDRISLHSHALFISYLFLSFPCRRSFCARSDDSAATAGRA